MDSSTISFSCEECTFDRTDVCGDCVVNFLLERDPRDAIVIDAEEARAVRMLQQASLVPTLRYERRVS